MQAVKDKLSEMSAMKKVKEEAKAEEKVLTRLYSDEEINCYTYI